MFCGQCGAQLPENAGYCPQCGIKSGNTITPSTPRNKSRKKFLKLSALLGACLILVLAVVLIVQGTTQGDGANTPEEAAVQFLRAIKNRDISALNRYSLVKMDKELAEAYLDWELNAPETVDFFEGWDEKAHGTSYYPYNMIDEGRSCVYQDYMNGTGTFDFMRMLTYEPELRAMLHTEKLNVSEITAFCAVYLFRPDGGKYLIVAQVNGRWYYARTGLNDYFGI